MYIQKFLYTPFTPTQTYKREEVIVKVCENLTEQVSSADKNSRRKICVHLCNQWDNVKNQKFLGYFRYFPYICTKLK